MERQYKSYDEEFKKTLVSLYESGKKLSELSREYGINESTIRLDLCQVFGHKISRFFIFL